MKKPSNAGRGLAAAALASPLALAWLPPALLLPALEGAFRDSLAASYRELSFSLGATLLLGGALAMLLGYLSVLSRPLGRALKSALDAVESVPAILVALFCYAPAAVFLASHGQTASSLASLAVFVLAATATSLPEAVRTVAIPLGELYHRKYSLSFRSYGFSAARILDILMASASMREALRRAAAGILLKTLVLDCSFGFIIQLGFGSYGTPAHSSPGALIAAHRDALFPGGDPLLFWLPALPLAAISAAFLILLGRGREEEL